MILPFDKVFKTINYPSGEFHIIANFEYSYCDIIVANIVDFNGLMKCFIGNNILRNLGRNPKWIIPFFPFAREDRRNNIYDGSELHAATDIAHQIGAVIVDAHSDVSAFKLRQFPQSEVVRQYLTTTDLFKNNPIVAIPDAGAAKKVFTWIDKCEVDYVQCLKKRDSATGKLSGFQVVSPEKVVGRDVVLVDDICDGGGTFIGLAQELRLAGARQLRLAVTHGLFTKGVFSLLKLFESIYTLDTTPYPDAQEIPALKLISLNKIIERGRVV